MVLYCQEIQYQGQLWSQALPIDGNSSVGNFDGRKSNGREADGKTPRSLRKTWNQK